MAESPPHESTPADPFEAAAAKALDIGDARPRGLPQADASQDAFLDPDLASSPNEAADREASSNAGPASGDRMLSHSLPQRTSVGHSSAAKENGDYLHVKAVDTLDTEAANPGSQEGLPTSDQAEAQSSKSSTPALTHSQYSTSTAERLSNRGPVTPINEISQPQMFEVKPKGSSDPPVAGPATTSTAGSSLNPSKRPASSGSASVTTASTSPKYTQKKQFKGGSRCFQTRSTGQG